MGGRQRAVVLWAGEPGGGVWQASRARCLRAGWAPGKDKVTWEPAAWTLWLGKIRCVEYGECSILPRGSFWRGCVWPQAWGKECLSQSKLPVQQPLCLAQCSRWAQGEGQSGPSFSSSLRAVPHHLAAWIEGHQAFVWQLSPWATLFFFGHTEWRVGS